VLIEEMGENTYHGDSLGGSHSDGGGHAGLAAAASHLAGGNLNESGSHSGSGVQSGGSLILIRMTGVLLVIIGGWGLSLQNRQWGHGRVQG